MRDRAPITDAMSVDLEDYFHVEAFADRIPRSQWDSFSLRVRENTERVLALFARHQCRATFFVLGWVAERDPGLIRQVAEAGHEVACHSYFHYRVNTLTPEAFREDLRRAKFAIEDAAGVKVLGFRAPTFSIVKESLWALDILADEGFEYDSSIFPVHHDRYGIPDAPRFAHWRQLRSGHSICEVPMATVRMGQQNFPAAGGGYLRLLPMWYTRWAMNRIHARDRQPVIIYFHPWEVDPGQPRLASDWKTRIRHYAGLRKTESRLDEILSRTRVEPIIDLVRRLPKPQLAQAQVAASN
ncbi:MAG TPA: XrtA system polysaccharide deacetylase [Terriglobales bacterium]|nr:XrtA system polysaccharide deacetylase [Terriglobales bacterium]